MKHSHFSLYTLTLILAIGCSAQEASPKSPPAASAAPVAQDQSEPDEKGREIQPSDVVSNQHPGKTDWHDPTVACQLLAHIDGMKGRPYREGMSDWCCLTPYKDIGRLGFPPNNIAFYAYGDQQRVTKLMLVVNVNEAAEEKEAKAVLAETANELLMKVASQPISLEMRKAILAGKSGIWQVGPLSVKLKRDTEYIDPADYGLEFTIM